MNKHELHNGRISYQDYVDEDPSVINDFGDKVSLGEIINMGNILKNIMLCLMHLI